MGIIVRTLHLPQSEDGGDILINRATNAINVNIQNSGKPNLHTRPCTKFLVSYDIDNERYTFESHYHTDIGLLRDIYNYSAERAHIYPKPISKFLTRKGIAKYLEESNLDMIFATVNGLFAASFGLDELTDIKGDQCVITLGNISYNEAIKNANERLSYFIKISIANVPAIQNKYRKIKPKR